MSKKNQATLFETATKKTPPERKSKQELAVIPREEPSVAMMMQAIIEKGITADNMAVLQTMCEIREREEAKAAERAFATAFHALMAEIPTIAAIKPVPAKDGSIKYYVAPLDEIDRQLRPMASKHGFTYRWEEGECPLPDRITEKCIVQHVTGHKEISPYTVRRSAPTGANDSQADVSTHSYARRGSLCDAFGIIIDHSDDARIVGKTITPDEARDLKARVEHCGANEAKFLRWANSGDESGTYETISEYKLDEALRWLEQYEQKNSAGKQSTPVSPAKISAEGAGNCVHCGKELVIEHEQDGGGIIFIHKETGALKCEGVK